MLSDHSPQNTAQTKVKFIEMDILLPHDHKANSVSLKKAIFYHQMAIGICNSNRLIKPRLIAFNIVRVSNKTYEVFKLSLKSFHQIWS